jgi:hypothetical protein
MSSALVLSTQATILAHRRLVPRRPVQAVHQNGYAQRAMASQQPPSGGTENPTEILLARIKHNEKPLIRPTESPPLIDGNKVGQLTRTTKRHKTMMNQESRKLGLKASDLGKVAVLCSALITLGIAGCCNETKPTPAPAPVEGKQPVAPPHHG